MSGCPTSCPVPAAVPRAVALVSWHGPGSARAAPSPDLGSPKRIRTKNPLQPDLGRGHRRALPGEGGPQQRLRSPAGLRGLRAAGTSPQGAQRLPPSTAHQLPREPKSGTAGSLFSEGSGEPWPTWKGVSSSVGNHRSRVPKESHRGHEQLPKGHLLVPFPFLRMRNASRETALPACTALPSPGTPAPSVSDLLSDILPFNLATWLD